MPDLENESTSKLNAFNCEIYLNNVKSFSLNLTDKPRHGLRTHYSGIAVWGNIYSISWNEPKHKNILYWKNAKFFDVNVERSCAVCCALKD